MQLSFLVGVLAAAVASASTITPPVLPLFVRNPYLSTWVRSRDAPWEKWPIFWTGDSVSFVHMANWLEGKSTWRQETDGGSCGRARDIASSRNANKPLHSSVSRSWPPFPRLAMSFRCSADPRIR